MPNNVIKPSLNRFSGLDGRPGDNVQFWHKGRQAHCRGIIKSVSASHYEILGLEDVKPGEIAEGYITNQSKRACIITGR